LDRLMTGRVIAQLGATIGRQFAYDLLAMVSQLDDTTLQRELSRLMEAEIVYQRGVPPQATYMFKHALIQDAAYQSLLKSTRQQYHQRIAQVLEAQFPGTVDSQPELLAHHCTEAGLTEQSVTYSHKPSQKAIDRSAHVEAVSHLRTGLALLQTLPETSERTQREVDMLIALGASLRATQGTGAPEVGATYARAHQLCQHLDNPHQLFLVLRGLCMYYYLHAELQTSYALGEQILTLGQHTQDPGMLSAAHRLLGTTLYYLGRAAKAHTHFTQGIALYDPKQHRDFAFLYGEDAGVTCRSYGARALWLLGYLNQGRTQVDEAVTLAQQLAHPFSMSIAMGSAAICHQFRREWRRAQDCAEANLSLAKEQGFPFFMAISAILRGWALAHQGHSQEGIEQINQGMMDYRATGAEIARPYWLALLADAHGIQGEPEAGLTALAEALTLTDTTGERWSEAELYRLKGALLLQQNAVNQAEAENCFQHAISIAQSQQAKSWELRATTSLARLWQQQGK